MGILNIIYLVLYLVLHIIELIAIPIMVLLDGFLIEAINNNYTDIESLKHNKIQYRKEHICTLLKYISLPIIALGIIVWDFLTPISLAIKTIKIVVLIVSIIFLLMSLRCLWILVSCCISGRSNEDGYLHSILRYVIITIITIILIILTIKGLK